MDNPIISIDRVHKIYAEYATKESHITAVSLTAKRAGLSFSAILKIIDTI